MDSDGPILSEIRERAQDISSRFDNDLDKYVAYLKKKEAEHPQRLVSQLTVVHSSHGRAGAKADPQ